jgi:hypothetical protein
MPNSVPELLAALVLKYAAYATTLPDKQNEMK